MSGLAVAGSRAGRRICGQAVVALVALLGLAGCPGTVPRGARSDAGDCGPNNCEGCCRDGVCQPGGADDACGTGGGTCASCTVEGGRCDAAQKRCSVGACTPSCDGKCTGADDGCGGVCAAGNCAGCCREGACMDGDSAEACGRDSAECANCAAGGGDCAAGACSNCTPSCAGKCAGSSDSCGGTCSGSGCPGCCEGLVCLPGTAQGACGKTGAQCADCGTEPCQGGTCSGCTPDCTGKCQGSSDGCGGSCSTNKCPGCCDKDTAKCYPGTTKAICGDNGERCWVCPDSYSGFSWKCENQVCVHDQPVGGECAAKTSGTTSCKSGTGKCWDQACCTGCWDKAAKTCRVTGNGADKTCGKAGAACVDCTATGQTCSSSYACQGTVNPCAGKADGIACSSGGVSGHCWKAVCCSGCWRTIQDWCFTTSNGDNNLCGKGGVQCVDCTASGKVCSKPSYTCAAPPCGGPCKAYETCDTVSNTCKVNENSSWNVKAVSAAIDCVNRQWDTALEVNPFCIGADCVKPDVSVSVIWTPDPATCRNLSNPKWRSSRVDNSCAPEWNQLVVDSWGSKIQARSLRNFCVQLTDTDQGLSEIGTCIVHVKDGDFRQGTFAVSDCKNSDGKDYLYVLMFQLAYAP